LPSEKKVQALPFPEEDEAMNLRIAILVLILISACLSPKEPEAPKRNLTIMVKPVEAVPLGIEYSPLEKRLIPTGYLEFGALRLWNKGGDMLYNLSLRLTAKKELKASERDYLRHTPGFEGEPRLIRDVLVKPDSIFIKALAPGETREFLIAISVNEEGNLFGIEVTHGGARLWGMLGSVDLNASEFPFEEFKYLTGGAESIIVVHKKRKIFTPGDEGFEELKEALLDTASKVNLQARCAFTEEKVEEIRRNSYAVELILRKPRNVTIGLDVKHALFILDKGNIFLSGGAGDWSCWGIEDADWTPRVRKLLEGLSKVNGVEEVILKDLEWNGDYWLIAGSAGRMERGILVRYDGRIFIDLSSEAGFQVPFPISGGRSVGTIDALSWNSSEWLIAGGGYCKGGGLLKSYDGIRFVNLTEVPKTYSSKEEFSRAMRNISGIHCVSAIAWNGSEWLLSSLFPKERLIRYGEEFKTVANLRVNDIAWGRGYWLLVTEGIYSKLMKYDGATFEEVTPFENITIKALAWNGSEWLISGAFLGQPDHEGVPALKEGFLVRYDGVDYEDLNLSDYVDTITWTGAYWLLGGDKLLRYDGGKIEEVPLPRYVSAVSKIRWGGDYGLVIGHSEEKSMLLRYDGNSFQDLTQELSGAMKRNLTKSCNDEYCLLYGKGFLARYDKTSYIDLTSEAGISPNESVAAIAWSGGYWLLGVSSYDPRVGRRLGKTYTSKLLRYDGETFTDLSSEARLNETHIRGVKPKVISVIGCLQDYCLIGYWVPFPGGNGGLLKYSEKGIEELSREGEVVDMVWNGREWLIHYRKGEFHASVVEIYDGAEKKKILPPAVRFWSKEEYWVKNYTWDPERQKWVIKAKVGTPLSEEPPREVVVEYPGEPQRAVCGPTVLLLITMLPAFICKRGSRI
jgi:hypothetical protein